MQRSAKVGAPDLVKFNTAPVYHFSSSLHAAFTQPGAFTLADLCTSRGQGLREFTQHSFLIEISFNIWFGRRTLPCGRHWWTFPKRKRVLVVASTDSAANVDVVKQKTSCCSSHSRVQFLLPQRTINGKREFLQPQKWMRQRVFSALGIQTGPFAFL